MYYDGMYRVGVDLEPFLFFWEDGWGSGGMAVLGEALFDQRGTLKFILIIYSKSLQIFTRLGVIIV